VFAAAAGEVVYSGAGLIGYGELVIIKHSDTFLSAYGHNRKRLTSRELRLTRSFLTGQLAHKLIVSARGRDGERQFDGWDYLTLGNDGLVTDFMVMVRPLSATLELAELMKQRFEAASPAA